MTTAGAVANRASGIFNKIPKLAKVAGLGSLVTYGMCIFDFMDVPSAYKLKYNDLGKKIEGISFKSGLKETGKSLIRCASYFVLPALLLNPLGCGGAIAATVASVGRTLLPMIAIPKLWEKVLPSEQKIVSEACQKRGISYNPKATDNPDGHDVDKVMNNLIPTKINPKQFESLA